MNVTTEFVPADRVVWQSETAKSYLCPFCSRWIRSQHEGEAAPSRVSCTGKGHELQWPIESSLLQKDA